MWYVVCGYIHEERGAATKAYITVVVAGEDGECGGVGWRREVVAAEATGDMGYGIWRRGIDVDRQIWQVRGRHRTGSGIESDTGRRHTAASCVRVSVPARRSVVMRRASNEEMKQVGDAARW